MRSAPSGDPPSTAPARLTTARDLLLVLAAAFACYHNFTAFHGYVFEDSYITYRYADNLASGQGFVFNPGERLLGTSTPLYTLLLASLGRLGFDIPAAGGFLTAFCLSLLALAGAWILRRHGHGNLAVVHALIVLWGSGGMLFLWGMETAFYCLLLHTAMIFALLERPVATGVFIGLACLTRHDGVLFAGVLGAVLWLKAKKIPWRTIFAAAVVMAPWFLFSWLYFGSLSPNTLGAKIHTVGMGEYMLESLVRLQDRLFTPLYRFASRGDLPPLLFTFLTLAAVAPIFVRALRLWRREVLLFVLAAHPAALWLGYSYIGPPLAHRWYLLPGAFFVMLLAFLAWGSVFSKLDLKAWPAVASLLLIGASVFLLPATVSREAEVMQSASYRARAGAYASMARWIDEHGLNDLKLFTREPGYLTYHSRNPVVDGAGLVTPGIRYHGTTDRQTPMKAILETHRPELAVAPHTFVARRKLEGFLLVYETLSKGLFIREDVARDRAGALGEDWLREDFPHPSPVEVGHPFHFDFERGEAAEGWWGVHQFIGAPEELLYGGKPVEDDYLTTHKSIGGPGNKLLMSPPFRIDFDELSLRFAATGGRSTSVRLIVNGQTVLAVDGTELEAGVMERIRWPVYSWRGLVGVLRFTDRSARGFVAADAVRSIEYQQKVVFDDFESGAYGERWASGFDERPLTWAELAADRGVRFISGEYSAVSSLAEGRQTMESRPFAVERESIAMTVFDFGGPDTGVELRVGGKTVRRLTGTDSGEKLTLVWRVARFRGKEAVLAVVDGDERAEKGIGIDDVVFFNGR